MYMVSIYHLAFGFDDYECIHSTNLSSDIKTLYFRYVRCGIVECFTNISERVRDAIFSHFLPRYGFQRWPSLTFDMTVNIHLSIITSVHLNSMDWR